MYNEPTSALIWSKSTLYTILSKVSVEKLDAPFEISSESRKLTDLYSVLNAAEEIDTSICFVSYREFYFGTETLTFSVYSYFFKGTNNSTCEYFYETETSKLVFLQDHFSVTDTSTCEDYWVMT